MGFNSAFNWLNISKPSSKFQTRAKLNKAIIIIIIIINRSNAKIYF